MYNWEYTCYAGAEEQIPDDVPKPLGKRVISSAYKDANLHHDLLSGKAVTGILHFLNKTPIDWYSNLSLPSKQQHSEVSTSQHGPA